MKKIATLAMAVVLTAAMFTGCGCRNQNVAPTTAPTTQATTAPTHATTEMTTVPTTEHTVPSTNATIDNGNGPLEDTTVTEGTVEGRARHVVPGSR